LMENLTKIGEVAKKRSIFENPFFQEGRASAQRGDQIVFSKKGYWVKRLVSAGDYNGWYKLNKTFFALKFERSGKIMTGVWIGFLSAEPNGVFGDCQPMDDEEKNLLRQNYERNNILPVPELPKGFESQRENGYLFSEAGKDDIDPAKIQF
jgi:hypothetical protein